MTAIPGITKSYEATANANKDTETTSEVNVKQECVDVLQGLPAPIKEDVDPSFTIRKCR